VMSPLMDQVPRERSHRVGSQSASLGSPSEEEVDSCVAKIGLALLVVLDQSHELAFPLDRKRLRLVASLGLSTQLRLVRRAPPARDAGFGLDLGYPLDVFSPARSKHDVPAARERCEIDRAARRSRVISFHRTSSFALLQPSVVPLILGRAATGFRPYVHLANLLPRRPTARQSSSIYSSPCPPCRRRRKTLRRHSRCGTLRDPDNVGPDDPGHGRDVELLER
jgi:hypothetical protein